MKDYIDRIALLSFLRREANEARIYADENGGESIVYAECLEDVIADIERIPAADVEPVRHSHWEWMNTNKYTQILTCSTCGARIVCSTVKPRIGMEHNTWLAILTRTFS